MKQLFIILFVATLSSCAMTYKKPTHTYQEIVLTTDNISETISNLRGILLSEGYVISSSGSDFISTAPKTVKLTPEDADCGTTMGIDYLKDNRTITKVAINLFKKNDTIIVIRANVSGEYLTSNVSQSVTMECVSKGKIEEELKRKIS